MDLPPVERDTLPTGDGAGETRNERGKEEDSLSRMMNQLERQSKISSEIIH